MSDNVQLLSSAALAAKAQDAQRAAEEAQREAQRAKAAETKLSADEKKTLERCETVIAAFITKDWRTAATKLASIRDGKLYRQTHSTWEKYLRDRWDLGKRAVDQWILASDYTRALPDQEKMSLTSALLLCGNASAEAGHVTTQEERETAWGAALKAAGNKKIVPSADVRKAMEGFVPAKTSGANGATGDGDGDDDNPNGTVVEVTEADTWELSAVTVALLRRCGIQSAHELARIVETLAEKAGDSTLDAFLQGLK